MQNNQFPHYSDDMGDGNMNYPYDGNMNYPYPYASASSFDDLFPPCAKLPFHGVELQPSPVCPKNFVIFDQTYDHNSQVMYHPDLTPRLVNSGLASTFQNEYVGGGYGGSYGNYGQEVVSSSYQEDPNEIDALLSTDEDEEGEEEDGGDSEEVISTARNASSREYGNTSAETCYSSYGCNSSSRRKQSSSGSAASSSNNDGKGGRKKKMKKMMGMLRKIVPGGEEMNTASVLDEAVQYLKSLKLEAQKLGHFSNQS
ncbi:transcription factor bHLH144-like [Raphanus sativus]|uniref:Transcription factor bHLH144-like n=1 Tax=Raphanus sativus TaxID=3726 RepID=A0A9W3C7P9_RAPSA|nr:transcription factor bHLH144-like [Raphanus sativus]